MPPKPSNALVNRGPSGVANKQKPGSVARTGKHGLGEPRDKHTTSLVLRSGHTGIWGTGEVVRPTQTSQCVPVHATPDDVEDGARTTTSLPHTPYLLETHAVPKRHLARIRSCAPESVSRLALRPLPLLIISSQATHDHHPHRSSRVRRQDFGVCWLSTPKSRLELQPRHAHEFRPHHSIQRR